MGIETILAVGVAAAGAASAGYSAVDQNQRAKANKGAARKVAMVKGEQVREQGALERLKTIRRSAQVRGRLRLAGAEAGLGDFGSLDALQQQNELDTDLNLDVLQQNVDNSTGLIGSELSSVLSQISGTYRNALLSGFEGALGGASQGLQLGSGLKTAFPETFG